MSEQPRLPTIHERVAQLYKDILVSQDASTTQYVNNMLQAFGNSQRQIRKAAAEAAKMLKHKGTK